MEASARGSGRRAQDRRLTFRQLDIDGASPKTAGMIAMPLILQAGLALAYGALATAALWGLGRALGRPLGARTVVTLFAVLVFVALTQHPLPDRTVLAAACPLASARPEWVPLGFAAELVRRAGVVGIWPALVDGRLALASAMNVLFPALIGMALARHPLRGRTAAALGLALSLAVELTQLTGVWGLYPCAYRRFDVDDVLLNTLGTALGVWAARRAGGGRRPPPGTGRRGGRPSGSPVSSPAP